MRTKRFLASLIALLMLFTLLPAAALAEEPIPEETEAQAPREEIQDEPLTGFFLVGSMNGWTPSEDYRFAWNNGSPLQFVIQCNLSAGDEFKGVQVENGTIIAWFPDPGGNYVVDAAQAGYKTIYFRPYETSEWGSNFLIADPPAPQQYHVSTSVNSPVHGSLSVSPEYAFEGETVTVTVTPEEGYVLQNIDPWGITKIDDTTYTFEMPGSDTTVYATFKLAPGYYFDNTNRVVPDYYVPEEAFSPSTSPFGEWERETTLTEGNYLDVDAVYAPELASERTGYYWCFQTMKLTYSSSSDRPKVTPEQAGHAMVFLTETEREGYTKAIHLSRTYMDPSFVWDAWIIIKNFHTITVEQTENGSAAADLTEAYESQTVTLTATPAAGYRLGAFTVLDAGGSEIPVEGNSFAMPDGPVTVTASFIPEGAETYTVTVDANISNGSVTADKTTAAEGEAVSLTVTPDEGYQLETLTVTDANGGPVELNGTSFLMPASNVTVTATFVLIPPPTYTVTVDASIQNGSVTADKETALEGETVNLTVTPNPGYALETLTVTEANGSPVTLNGTSFLMPASNVTVTASFVPVYYTVTLAGAGEGVTITSTKQTAMEGENVDVNIVTDSTHRFVSITVTDEGGNVIPTVKRPDGANKYRFVMPASNVTVTVVTQEIYPLWLGATQVSSLNYTDILGDGSASYDPATRTLSFSSAAPAFVGNYGGALINYTADDSLTIEAPNGLTLAASGSDGTTYAIYSYGANIVVNGDLTLNFPDGNGVWLTMGTLTVNGDVDGTTKAFALYGGGGVAVDGSVNVTNQDSIRVVFSNGAVSISGDFTGVGYGVDARNGITIGGSATITASATANNYGLQSAAGPVSVGGDFSFSGKAQYAVSAAQGFRCAGSVTVNNSSGKGIYSANGAITVVSGTWDVTAVSEPLKAAGGITIPATHSVTEPEAGVVTLLDGFYLITEADGATLPTHVVIEPDEPPVGTITVTFDAGEGAVDPAAMDITAGAAIGELPTPTREGGWVFMGWYMAPAATAFDICQGTEVTAATTFTENTKVYAHWRLPGDVNGDGNVDGTDVTLLATYVKAGGLNVRIVPYSGDVSGDDNVDGTDVTLLATFVKANGLNVVIH